MKLVLKLYIYEPLIYDDLMNLVPEDSARLDLLYTDLIRLDSNKSFNFHY